MKRMYFKNENSENCHEKDYFIDEMKDNGLTEIEVYKAVPDKNKEYFWCKSISDCCLNSGEWWLGCGKNCEDYEPCNGKSGKCRHKTHCYTHGEKVKIKLKKG